MEVAKKSGDAPGKSGSSSFSWGRIIRPEKPLEDSEKSLSSAPTGKGPLEYLTNETIWRDNSVMHEYDGEARWTVYSTLQKKVLFETDYALCVPLERRKSINEKYIEIMGSLGEHPAGDYSKIRQSVIDLFKKRQDQDVPGKVGWAMIGLISKGKKFQLAYAYPISDFNHSSKSRIENLTKSNENKPSSSESKLSDTQEIDVSEIFSED